MLEKEVTYIDITPTWSGILPAFIEFLERGTSEQKMLAVTELNKMASIADEYVALVKRNRE